MEYKRIPARGRTPEGYRLATLEQVSKDRDKLVKQGILDSSEARVVDGFARDVPNLFAAGSRSEEKMATFEQGHDKDRDKLVKQEILNSSEARDAPNLLPAGRRSEEQMPALMIVYGQTPLRMPRNSHFLRKELYSPISLDNEGRKTAFRLSLLYEDIEVIHWLRRSATQDQLQELIADYEQYEDDGFSKIVGWLLSENEANVDNIEEDGVKEALDYSLSIESLGTDHAIAIVEVVLTICSENKKMDLVYSQIDRIVRDKSETKHNKRTAVLAKLLSECRVQQPPERWKEIIEFHFENLFKEAVERGYISLVEHLLKLQHNGKAAANADKNKLKLEADGGTTLLHYAAEWEESKSIDVDAVCKLLFQAYEDESVRKVDNQERTVLHLASASGRVKFCEFLLQQYKLEREFVTKIDNQGRTVLHYGSLNAINEFCKLFEQYNLYDVVDGMGQNFVHYAAQGKDNFFTDRHLPEKILNSGLLSYRNNKGLSPLHQAAMYGKANMIYSFSLYTGKFFSPELKLSDFEGQTPLHLAARHGHLKSVEELLNAGSDPLEERDFSGKTALHNVVANTSLKTEDAKKLIDALVNHFKSEGQKALFLWASAIRIGTADETEGLHPDLKQFLEEKKKSFADINLLKEAALQGNSRLIWELLNRGGDVTHIPNNREFRWVWRQVEKFSEQATNRPTTRDTLGRRDLAECIAAHFLNPYIKSPITVSITGGSGMGKTSLMNMIEAELLVTAAHLAFPDLCNYENFKGVKRSPPSEEGKRMYQKIKKGVAKLLAKGKDREYKENTNPLVYFLEEYRPGYKAVYKYLACMDFNQLLENNEQDSQYESKEQSLGAVPRILTVNFSAGNYREMNEAWAGLAVEITREIEASMTPAQQLNTCWRNAWKRNPQNVYMKFIFPCLIFVFLAVWMLWAAWLFLEGFRNPQLKKLKYGSIPVTAIAIFRYAFKGAISVFHPVSKQLSGYFSLHDHSQQLGYQQKVISDIKFLKKETGKNPNIIFSLIAAVLCKYWWGPREENVEGTNVPKYGSAPENKLRIIAFVDDLDHCEEEVILRVLWAINLVFRECEINVILAMDKNTIKTAFKNSIQNQDEDFVDKFINKIIQLPVSLPDPADGEWESFLQGELGHLPNLNDDDQSVANGDQGNGRNDAESGYEGCIPFSYNLLTKRRERLSSWFTCKSKRESEQNQKIPAPCPTDGTNDVESGSEGSVHLPVQRLQRLSSWFTEILCWIRGFLCKSKREGESKQNEESLTSATLSKRTRQIREVLMQSFSKEEAQTFDKLRGFATGIQKCPREWICYINYHKFARNVIVRKLKHESQHPSAWQVEFVAWTFVCSQWKREMNILIQDWDSYTDVNKKTRKPSLKEIVANYINQRWPEGQANLNGADAEWDRLKQALDTVQEISMKGLCGFEEFQFKYKSGKHQRRVDKTGVRTSMLMDKEEKKEKKRWSNLLKALKEVQDVSMEGIECFQGFRFHCADRYLTLPDLNSDKP